MQLTPIFSIILLFLTSCGQKENKSEVLVKKEIQSSKKEKKITEDLLRNSDYYLSDLDLRTIAQLIVQDSVQPTDNKVTFSILDSATIGTTETRTYYSKAFDKIIFKSDGALSEVIGSYCIKSIMNNPNELLEWISSGKFECPSETIANYIAYDLVMSEQPKKEKAELFKKIKSDALNKSTSKFSKKFIDQINKEFELIFEE
jgi:hypothetical protein